MLRFPLYTDSADMRRLSLMLAALVLAACGTKGPLTLPPKPQSPEAQKPAPQPAATPADNSSKPRTGAAQ
jgi:predicted small lipoprotein YifL